MNFKFTKGFTAKVISLLGKETLEHLNKSKGEDGRSAKGKPAKSDAIQSSATGSYWFDPNKPSYLKNKKKHSDSWFRLEAFLNSRPPEELRKIDPSYGEPIQ